MEMTPKQAEKILEDGCVHNPWDGAVCENCAKDVLEVMVNLRTGRKSTDTAQGAKCRTCGDATHSTSEHVRWTAFEDKEDDF